MTEVEFTELKFQFTAKEEGSQQAVAMQFSKDDFFQVEGQEALVLFKMAAFEHIKKEKDPAKRKEMSLMHQILCDETAIVGVLKQAKKASGEMNESVIEFKRE